MKSDILKSRSTKVLFSLLRAVFLIAFAFILIYPVIFMIANSVKITSDTLNPAVKWFSLAPTAYGYKVAFMAMDYMKSLFTTFSFGLVSAFFEVAMCSVYAYGLARFKFRFKKILLILLVSLITHLEFQVLILIKENKLKVISSLQLLTHIYKQVIGDGK